MNNFFRSCTLLFLALGLFLVLWFAPPGFSQQVSLQDFAGMRWRLIGPFRGGRVLAVSGVPGKPHEYYFGAVGGGVWKTGNAGRTWAPIFDREPIASIGALAVAPSDTQTIYVGTGEADMRSDTSYGDGVYKSTDGGVTWRNMGLRDSQHIGRILIDPYDAKVVFVAALGHAYAPNSERGVYRSSDGGVTWKKVLYKNDDTGAIDLCFDLANSHVVFASLWQARRPPWSVYAPTNGPGSGLYKSTDGGVTWKQITGHGFPSEGLGRIGIAVAPEENGNRIFALVDAREAGLYRSDDAGETWRRVSSDHRIWQRGWYFGGVTSDPHNPNIVYVANTALYRSTDGGEHFEPIKGAPGGDDYHTLWIAPDDSQRMILGSDQGAAVSVDGGKTWSSWYNQPTAQFYHVITDTHFPYMVYGAQQDSGTAAVTSRSDYGQITFRDWAPVGADESGYIALNPDEPTHVYGGGPNGVLFRFDWTTGQSFNVSPWLPSTLGDTLRSSWTSPLVTSPHNGHVMYFGAQYVLRTDNGGMSWQPISPDLTQRDEAPDGTTQIENGRGVVYTIAPSPLRENQIWAGTDNGLIHLTTDAGKNWTNVTPKDLRDWSKISLIEASHFDAGTAYVAVDRHQLDDFHPYIYRTSDSGKTWRKIVAGLPDQAYVYAVREDPVRQGLLFAGTETGVFVSFDAGEHWQPLQLNLPVTSVRDLTIHGNDLIAATHGRSFWILDDIAPLREWNERINASDVYVFPPAHALRIRRSENHDTPLPPETPVGTNPPAGAIIDYFLKSQPTGDLVLEIHDKSGNLVRRFSGADKSKMPSEPPPIAPYWLNQPEPLSNASGMHRFVWDLRYARPPVLHPSYSMDAPIGLGTVVEPEGPLVLPGEYEVRLTADGKTYAQPLTVDMDPRVHISPDALAQQLALGQKIDEALAKTTESYRQIEGLRAQLPPLRKRLTGNPNARQVLATMEQFDRNTGIIAGQREEYPLPATGLVELDSSLASLAVAVGSADSAPTAQSLAAFQLYQKHLEEELIRWDALKTAGLSALNKQLQDAGFTTITSGASSNPTNP